MSGKGTTLRSIRIPDNPWEPARERAQREGTTLSAVIREAVDKYAHPDSEEKKS
jgi:predicted DNA-binding protein